MRLLIFDEPMNAW